MKFYLDDGTGALKIRYDLGSKSYLTSILPSPGWNLVSIAFTQTNPTKLDFIIGNGYNLF